MNTNQKIVGNLGVIEIIALAVGAGAAAYFILHVDTSTALEVGESQFVGYVRPWAANNLHSSRFVAPVNSFHSGSRDDAYL